ncbi:hypothetical protein N7468_006986 [Penicillium chermesinum]|uniref:NACHT domain-containing protein n=1 Tax=Penicillium chermesinum TaxID=63820 RepID=A0A9W9NTZ8_9EURO|nr:uncharacterized protein N7468_006986 [Penicillium chermesinum]KAJ5225761.1 hypothetical protein N7468_006986 [Penicillium chermesinum]
MAKNHTDLQDALLESSGYLADLLARCAFIEDQFYRDIQAAIAKAEKEKSMIRVYVAILQYSAKVCRAQHFSMGRHFVESIAAVASQQLAQLKTSIEAEESHLHHWLLLDQHLHRQAEAEAILTRIDTLVSKIETVHKAVDMLNLPSADGAFFDSFKDQHEDECLPGTRKELLQQVKEWGRSSDKSIFWLSGMAGTGKSTIARTVARSFKEDGMLGATFFFKRGEGDRGSAEKLFPTIVAQLAVHIPQMIVGIRKAIDDDPAIARKSLQEQFDKLMLQPLLAVDRSQSSTSPVVVIDALDECEREEDVAVILELLPKVEKATCLKLRFFLTSRPEATIRFGFDQIDQGEYQNTILQNLDNEVIRHDITLYLREEFRRIRQKRHRDLPPDWPGAARIDGLAAMAVPLFIFAATVCRFVADKRWNPERRLQQFFEDSLGSKMDKTYRPILNQLLAEDENDTDQLVEEFQKTIGVIVLLATPLSLSALTELLEMPEDDISTRLDAFHSVLTIPDDPNLPIRALHLSFHDYLVDKRTKAQESTSRFWVDTKKKHEFIVGQCLAVMRRLLRKNICNLPSYGTSRSEIDSASIARFLPPVLQYTCRYWVYHLAQSSLPAQVIDQILVFLEEHFLHWLEVMAISGIISECLNALDTLLELTKDSLKTPIFLFLSDARRYTYKFVNIVDMAPLQLYSSGLVFAPQRSLIRTDFARELPDWLSRGPRVQENWSPELQTLEGHSDVVWSVAFSRDGQILASGSSDETIKLWDPATGTLKRTLEGHSDMVWSVAFSQNDQILASGSADETIKLWDPITGILKHTLEGHSEGVWSVAFSPDGQILASSSYDKTIKLWDPITGTLKHTLRGPFQRGVSIKLWDPVTGILKHTLEGHSEDVWSVAFSPDGQILASGSDDETIKLWDPITGTLKHTLESHSKGVLSLTFSQDTQILASGSRDRTIKLWDPVTGTLKHTLEGHSDMVWSVAFSRDGLLLASGSYDKTIKLWDPATGTLRHTISTHSSVTHVEFSEKLPWLNTNLGSFDIGVFHGSLSSNPSEKVAEVSLAGRWVTIQGQRELWLPPDYQPTSSAVKDSTIALGCANGRVAIIAFSVKEGIPYQIALPAL